MKAGFTTLAKLLALCVFLGLLSGYVYYRYDQGKKAEAQELAAQRAIEEARKKQALADAAATEAAIKELEVFSSPKSGPVVMPSSKRAIVMPSSKIGTIDIDDEDLQRLIDQAKKEGQVEVVEPEPKPEKKRTIMPGSKSFGGGGVFPEGQQPKQQQEQK